jgi:CBS domain containing-hemolysin-like protein
LDWGEYHDRFCEEITNFFTLFLKLAKSSLPWFLSLSGFFNRGYLQIVFGELYPKSLALIYAEPMARLLAAPIGVISRIFKPFIGILNQSTRFLLVLTRIPQVDSTAFWSGNLRGITINYQHGRGINGIRSCGKENFK